LLTCCDGRTSKKEALKTSIQNFKEKVTPEKHMSIPESRFTSATDTLLASGLRVKVKTETDENRAIVISQVKDGIHEYRHFKNFIFSLELWKDQQLLVNEIFDRPRINRLLTDLGRPVQFKDKAVLYALSLDQEETDEQSAALDLVYKIPESDHIEFFKMYINTNGSITMNRFTQL
jgi:hypothetical protein